MKLFTKSAETSPALVALRQRRALLTERVALSTELNELSAHRPPLERDKVEALQRLGSIEGRWARDTNRTGPEPAYLVTAREDVHAADAVLEANVARQAEIRTRRDEIDALLSRPAALSPADLRAHGKALAAARARLDKIDAARQQQLSKVARLEAVEDPRPDLACRRAELEAALLLGDIEASAIEEHDRQVAKTIAQAEEQARALAAARQVVDVLDAQFQDGEAELYEMEEANAEARVTVLDAELAPARADLSKAHQAAIDARARVEGIARLLTLAQRAPDPLELPGPLDAATAAMREQTRLAAAYPELFG
jgi:chromosome segregation ATPase